MIETARESVARYTVLRSCSNEGVGFAVSLLIALLYRSSIAVQKETALVIRFQAACTGLSCDACRVANYRVIFGGH